MPKDQIYTVLKISAAAMAISAIVVLALPPLFALTIDHDQTFTSGSGQFPVTVDPRNKTIAEDEQVNAFFASPGSPFQAAAGNAGGILWKVVSWIATAINENALYQSIAAVDGKFVTIAPGMRKEQVASSFANALSWNAAQKKKFLSASSTLPLLEGSFSPGTYLVNAGMTPDNVQDMVNKRFTADILSHYGTTTAKIVPLDEALTIASLIQRETIGTSDMRLVSGIIWNRLFAGMNLQIDSTLQYAKANTPVTNSWWPKVTPADMYRKSPYNTYLHPGLPPTPIANPSVAAVIAALNPVKTSCLYYFNDKAGDIHCTDTYAEHVALLKEYYGRGR
ncbi:MAG: endolytic transglycosylase MltG [Minisyncoccota bacterium]